MPLYLMKCEECERTIYEKFSMNEEHVCDCTCGGKMKQQITSPAIKIKPCYSDPQPLTRESWHEPDRPPRARKKRTTV